MSNFTVVWAGLDKRPELAQRFWCEGQSGSLPFLVDDAQLQDGVPIDFDEFMLVCGLLYNWADSPDGGVVVEEAVRVEQLGKLRDGFGFVDTQGLVGGAAHRVRLQYGHEASCRILRNGRLIFPVDSAVAADLAMDLGYMLSEATFPECTPLLEELLDTIGAVSREDVNPEAWQILLVLKLAALKLIGSEQACEDYLNDNIKGEITSPDLQVAINRISRMASKKVSEAFQPKEWTALDVQTMDEHECDH
jgi:hypothetical protein